MATDAPVSHHLRLYDYWLGKCGSRRMPARSDLDPSEITPLLPYIIIVDRADDQFRYRLMGTAVVHELGRDLTGTAVGSYIGEPKSANAGVRDVYKRAWTNAQPVFASGQFYFRTGSIHSVSLLALPLSADGVHAEKVIATLIARFNYGLTASCDWLKGMPLKVCSTADVQSALDLQQMCFDWEPNSYSQEEAAASLTLEAAAAL